MRILISTLLLAIFGDKKESRCSTGEELTSSFIPAGLQVVQYYITQINGSDDGLEFARRLQGASSPPGVPTVVVTYNTEEVPDSQESDIVEKLLKLSSTLDDEAAEQDLAACRGFTSEVMRQLESSSRMSSRKQLEFILRKIVGGEMKNRKNKDFVNGTIKELEDDDSELSEGLRNVTVLKYLSDLSLE